MTHSRNLLVGSMISIVIGSSVFPAITHAQDCPPAVNFIGATADDRIGRSVSGAGDVNNDGYANLIIGSLDNKAYVYSGQTGALLYAFTGEAERDLLGFSVSGAGDVDNDGYADLIVGASREVVGGDGAGRLMCTPVFRAPRSEWCRCRPVRP